MSSSRGFSSENCSQLFATLLPSFRQIAQKMKKKSGCHIFETPEIPPLTPIHVLFFWDFHNCKKSRTHPTFLFFFLQQRPWKKIMWTNFEFLWNIGGGGGQRGGANGFLWTFLTLWLNFSESKWVPPSDFSVRCSPNRLLYAYRVSER